MSWCLVILIKNSTKKTTIQILQSTNAFSNQNICLISVLCSTAYFGTQIAQNISRINTLNN